MPGKLPAASVDDATHGHTDHLPAPEHEVRDDLARVERTGMAGADAAERLAPDTGNALLDGRLTRPDADVADGAVAAARGAHRAHAAAALEEHADAAAVAVLDEGAERVRA